MLSTCGVALALASCASDADRAAPWIAGAAGEPMPRRAAEPLWADAFMGLAGGADQLAQTCARPGDDVVRDLFCADAPPDIGSLRDLELALGLDPAALGGVTGSALTAHSSSLSRRAVSAINPRAILYRLGVVPAGIEFVALAYARGEQFCELAALDRKRSEYSLYVVRFAQACNDAPEGCSHGDLFTDVVEQDWRDVTLYDTAALANSVLDCAPCHQPHGVQSPFGLRMQEFDAPWTHWLFRNTEGGHALLDDYRAARGDEPLAGLPFEVVEHSPPGGLSLLVGARDHIQPNPFASETIEREVRDSAALSGGGQPQDNRVPGNSPTWRGLYERAQRGEAIPVPYHDVKVTDPDKLERVSEAYRAFRAGELARAALPDVRDVFPDDPQRLADMGIMTQPGLTGDAVLLEACSQCHNERLDPSLSRARFRADLQNMSREEKDLAIARLLLPRTDPRVMPPARLRVLSEEARARAIETLEQD